MTIELLFVPFNSLKRTFVIPKSRDWDTANPGIQDWRKRSGFGILGLQTLVIWDHTVSDIFPVALSLFTINVYFYYHCYCCSPIKLILIFASCELNAMIGVGYMLRWFICMHYFYGGCQWKDL